MQDYVNFMGFMAYDLHGPWDTDVKTLGSLIQPQTDITEINKGLTPLWFDDVNPAKINLGIAYYGRSYKLEDPSCGRMGCSFVPGQGGAPGECTGAAGIMSNQEIRQLIEDDNITPILNETSMVKYFTYSGDSWIAYGDDETYAMKEEFANDRCLGGIIIWSIDFDAQTGGGATVVACVIVGSALPAVKLIVNQQASQHAQPTIDWPYIPQNATLGQIPERLASMYSVQALHIPSCSGSMI